MVSSAAEKPSGESSYSSISYRFMSLKETLIPQIDLFLPFCGHEKTNYQQVCTIFLKLLQQIMSKTRSLSEETDGSR